MSALERALKPSRFRAFDAVSARLARNPLLSHAEFVVGIGLLLLLAACAVAGPLVWRHDPLTIDLGAALQPPSWEHPMGTDNSGRDIFARFNHGARISLGIAAIVMVGAAVVGGAMGLVAGMARGGVDNALSRVFDSLLAFPTLILAMTVTLGLGAGLTAATIGVTLATVPFFGRLMRGEVLRIRSLLHVEAAVAFGSSRTRIALRHILPYTLTTMLVQAAVVFGLAILNLAALGYVGLGAQIPTPEWGAMITDGQQYALTGAWWVAAFPGLGLIVGAVAVNLVVDSLRDRLDPRSGAASR